MFSWIYNHPVQFIAILIILIVFSDYCEWTTDRKVQPATRYSAFWNVIMAIVLLALLIVGLAILPTLGLILLSGI